MAEKNKEHNYIPNSKVLANITSIETQKELDELKELIKFRLWETFNRFLDNPSVENYAAQEIDMLAYQNLWANLQAIDTVAKLQQEMDNK